MLLIVLPLLLLIVLPLLLLLVMNGRWFILIQNSDNHTGQVFAVRLAHSPEAPRQAATALHNVAC